MYAFTPTTVYPACVDVPKSHIEVLDKFFRIIDAGVASPSAYEEHRQIFTPDGVWKTPSAKFEGHDGK